MTHGMAVKIFYPDRNPAGLRIVDVSNWTIRALTVYRIHLQQLLDRPEISKPGIYFLVGDDQDTGKNRFYIGETKDFRRRIIQHQNREDWNQCIVFIRKDDTLNEAHVKWLEKKIYDELNAQRRVIINFDCLNNDISPPGTQLDESGIEEMEEFKESLYLILGCIGFPSIMNTNNQAKNQQYDDDLLYYLQIKEVTASMRATASGYILLKDSMICEDSATGRNDSTMKGTYRRRDEAISSNIIVRKNNTYILTDDIVFSSPSGAAQFVYGNSINGRERWKTKDNKTLNEIENLSIDVVNK